MDGQGWILGKQRICLDVVSVRIIKHNSVEINNEDQVRIRTGTVRSKPGRCNASETRK